jgi:hypothetical protein
MPARQRACTAQKPSHENAIAVNSFPCFHDDFSSFVKLPGEPDGLWRWAFPTSSYVVSPPPPEPLNHGLLRAGVLHAETYLAASLDAHIEGDVAAMAEALLVARGFVVAALDMLEASQCLRNTSDTRH